TCPEPRRREAFGHGARSLLMMATIEAPNTGGGWRPARWVVPFFAVLATLLLPWIVLLGVWLPAHHASAHWDITWVGFDAGLSLHGGGRRGSKAPRPPRRQCSSPTPGSTSPPLRHGSNSSRRPPKRCSSSYRSLRSACFSPGTPSASLRAA